jgi:ankyrin repeat protein
MSDLPLPSGLSLPEHASLRHLKHQAIDLLRAGHASSVADAQYRIARQYGFASWPKLKAHVDSQADVGELKQAIDTNDYARVTALMSANADLHTARLGYQKDGPLTWVAECRVPWEPPSPERLAIARWMVENGSDIHQGGDAPLMRAALNGDRMRMMELLVSLGANVNAAWHGYYPIIFAPCETVDPVSLRWLLENGADPNCGDSTGWRSGPYSRPGTALDAVIASYVRVPHRLSECVHTLRTAHCRTRYDLPEFLSVVGGRTDELIALLDDDRSLVAKRFPELDIGVTAERMLTLRGATLLHVAAEFGNVDAARALLDRGADMNERAAVDEQGVGGQTALFHAATQFGDAGLPMLHLLIERGADLNVRATVPGHYERPNETVECTALGYAQMFPEGQSRATELLRGAGAQS